MLPPNALLAELQCVRSHVENGHEGPSLKELVGFRNSTRSSHGRSTTRKARIAESAMANPGFGISADVLNASFGAVSVELSISHMRCL